MGAFVSWGSAHMYLPQSMMAIVYIAVLPMVALFYMVIPPVKRVLTGEKVVVSNLLKQMTSTVPRGGGVGKAETPSEKLRRQEAVQTASDQRSAASSVSTVPDFASIPISAKIVMKRGEAIPPSVENELYRLEEVIGSIKHNM